MASKPDHRTVSFPDELLDEGSLFQPWNAEDASERPSTPTYALARGGGAAVLVPVGTPGAVEAPRQNAGGPVAKLPPEGFDRFFHRTPPKAMSRRRDISMVSAT